jgi:hypothetical protein
MRVGIPPVPPSCSENREVFLASHCIVGSGVSRMSESSDADGAPLGPRSEFSRH